MSPAESGSTVAPLNQLDHHQVSLEQRGTLSSIQESISVTRLHLLSATAAARDQMRMSQAMRNSFTDFQDDIVLRLATLSVTIDFSRLNLEKSIEENTAALAGLDETEVMLRHILQGIRVTETRRIVPQPSSPSPGPRESQFEIDGDIFGPEARRRLVALGAAIEASRLSLRKSIEEKAANLRRIHELDALPTRQPGESYEELARRTSAYA